MLCVVTKTMRDPASKKAPVPKKDEKPIHGLVSDKNFIVANAVENILAGKLQNQLVVNQFEFSPQTTGLQRRRLLEEEDLW